MATSKSNAKKGNQAAAARRKRNSGSSGSSSGSSSSSPKKIETSSTVAARAALEQGQGVGPIENLERQARDQEQRQQRELRDGVATGAEKQAADARAKRAEIDRASVRAGGATEVGRAPGLQGGLVDQLTRRSDADARTGHMVRIDLNADGIPEQLRESGSDYGVFLEAASTDPETGYPVTARVRLRDDTHREVVVPYESLREAPAGNRR